MELPIVDNSTPRGDIHSGGSASAEPASRDDAASFSELLAEREKSRESGANSAHESNESPPEDPSTKPNSAPKTSSEQQSEDRDEAEQADNRHTPDGPQTATTGKTDRPDNLKETGNEERDTLVAVVNDASAPGDDPALTPTPATPPAKVSAEHSEAITTESTPRESPPDSGGQPQEATQTGPETDTRVAQTEPTVDSRPGDATDVAKDTSRLAPESLPTDATGRRAETEQSTANEEGRNPPVEPVDMQAAKRGGHATTDESKRAAPADTGEGAAKKKVKTPAQMVAAALFPDGTTQTVRTTDHRGRVHFAVGDSGKMDTHGLVGRASRAAQYAAFPTTATMTGGAIEDAMDRLSEPPRPAGLFAQELGGESGEPGELASQSSRPALPTERALEQPTGHQARAESTRELSHADQTRLIQRVARAMEAAPQRGGTVRLRLRPPELGVLRLEVRLEKGNLTAKLEADTQAARNVLLDHLPQLRDRLAEQGIRIDQFDVGLSQQDTGQSQQGRTGHAEDQPGGQESGSDKPNQDDLPDDQNASGEIATVIGQRELDVVV